MILSVKEKRNAAGKGGMDTPIVRPVVPKAVPPGGHVAVMVGTRTDLSHLMKKTTPDPVEGTPLFLSRLYRVNAGSAGWYLAGPMMGAPYAVMLLETLVAMGAKKILFYGWCGAVSKKVCIGDILLPTEAVIDEGTSRHYPNREEGADQMRRPKRVAPSAGVQEALRGEMMRRRMAFHEGPVWTTDAIFRETPRKTAHHQRQGVSAVEMEASALFSAGRFHGVAVGAVMVVSDEIASFTWVPGFKDPRFQSARQQVCDVVCSVCQLL